MIISIWIVTAETITLPYITIFLDFEVFFAYNIRSVINSDTKYIIMELRMKKKIDKLIPASLVFILLFQVVLVLFMNCTRTATFLDYDSALVLRHAVEMWRNKQLVFHDFANVSSLEIDCVPFFAAPIYMLTGHAGVSYAVMHLIVMLFFGFVVSDIFKRCSIGRRYACLALIFIFIPYTLGQLEYSNMLFISAGQYAFRVVTLLFGIDVLMMKKCHGIKDIIVLILFTGFLMLTTLSTGSYMVIMVIFPMALFLAVGFLYDRKSFPVKKAFFVVLLFIACAAVLWLRKNYFGAEAGREQHLCTYDAFPGNIASCICGIFALLGGITWTDGINVFSVTSIQTLIKFVFFILMFGFEIRMIRKKKLFSSSPLVRACVLITGINLFILFVTDTRYGATVFEYRYHILWIVENFLCFAACLYEYNKKEKKSETEIHIRQYMSIVIAVMIVVSNGYGFYRMYTYNSCLINAVSDISAVAEKNNQNNVLFYGKNEYISYAHVLRAIDIDTNAVAIKESLTGANILDYYIDSADSYAMGPENLLVTTKDAFNFIPEYARSEYRFVGEKDGNAFYLTENNMLDFQSGFPKYLDTSIDYVQSDLYKKTSDKDGNVTAESQFTAPYDAYKYTYSINVEFSGDKSGQSVLKLEGADFELSDTADDGKLSIENIDVLQRESLSLSLTFPSDMKIDRILFTRKSK